MSGYHAHVDAVVGVVKRDFFMYISYRTRLGAQALSVLSSLALFFYVSKLVGKTTHFENPQEYFAYVVVGVAILQMLTMSLVLVPNLLRQELVAGTFERLVTSPAGAIFTIASMTLFPAALALVIGAYTIIVAAIVFGVDIDFGTAVLAIPAASLGLVAFAPISLLFCAAVLAFRQAATGANMLITLLSLIGGFLFPVSLLPSWIRWASDVQPFTPAVDLLRDLLIGTPADHSAWVSVLKLAAFTAVLFPVSGFVTKAALSRSQRRGTVIEY